MTGMTGATPSKRGAFIVVEGLDRSGKTTQVERLRQALLEKGEKVEQMRFPDRITTIGKMIDSYLQSKSDLEDHVIHLLFSANRWELATRIETLIANGVTVLCDRYYYSGMVYSAAKQNPELSLEWAREPDVGLPRPDLVLFMDLDEDTAQRRGGFGDEKYEKRDMQERVRKLFHRVRAAAREENDDIVVVDAGRSVDEVAVTILDTAEKTVQSVREGQLGGDLRRVGKWS